MFGVLVLTLAAAVAVLTDHQGGFPREGFVLGDRPKPGVAYVDLHRNSRLTGRFAAIDQILPHELLHHVLRQLVGPFPEGGANQVHAIGVRTDPFVAFNEGFAEHAQVVAVDDPDAAPDTAALVTDRELVRRTNADLVAYRRSLTATWAPATRARLGFVLWFSQGEDVLRYHAVKANRFAFEPVVPAHLLRPRNVYRAYLLQNVLPGDASGTRKSPGRLLSSEGAISALFARWVSEAALGLSSAWISDTWSGTIAWILPMALFGVPAALWQLIRHRSAAPGVRVLAAWMLAALAPYALTRPWG